MEKSPVLSIIIPCHNEEKVISQTLITLTKLLVEHNFTYEIIAIDDGSTDDTFLTLVSLKESLGIRVLKLVKNSGHMSALMAGFEVSTGSYIATMDADLQDPPKYLIEMMELIRSSEDNIDPIEVVQTYRIDRTADTFFKRNTASIYYWIIRKLTGVVVHPHAADYRVVSRRVLEKILSLPTRKVVLRILIPQLGFKISYFPIVRDARYAGKTKYNLKKMILLAIDSVVVSSFRPMRILAIWGFILSLLFLFLAIIVVILSFVTETVPGWSSLVLLFVSVSAFNFACLGALGEYVGRSYDLIQGRPAFIYKEID